MDELAAIKSIVEKQAQCTVITLGRNGCFRARTMTRLNSLDDGCLYFPTDIGSAKVEEIREDPRVTVFVSDPITRDTANLFGTGEIVMNRKVCGEAWKEPLRHRWADGPSDPNFAVVKVTLESGEYLIAAPEIYGKVRF